MLQWVSYIIKHIIRQRKLDDSLKMNGIQQPNDIGFLTINEYFKFTEIGTYYKNPLMPIWITFMDQKFQTIFGWTSNTISNGPELVEFDLVFINDISSEPVTMKIRRNQEGVMKDFKIYGQIKY